MPINAAAQALLADAFALLCYARGRSPAAQGQFLRPRHLVELNAALAEPDPAPAQPWRAERETGRIRLVHALCAAHGLVAVAGRAITPTPQAALWLRLAPEARIAALFAAALRADPAAQSRWWRAFRFPGWRLVTPDVDLASACDFLLAHAAKRALPLARWAAALPVPLISGDADADPAALARSLARLLAALGMATVAGERALRLTPLGLSLLRAEHWRAEHPPTGASEPGTLPRAKASLDVAGQNYRLTPLAPADLFELSEVAQITRSDPPRFRLEEAMVKRALADGATADRVADLLSDALGGGLPRPVANALRAWSRQQRRLTLRRAIVLEAHDAELLQALTRRRAFRECIERTYSPRAVVIRADRLSRAVRGLRAHDVEVAASIAPGTEAAAPTGAAALAHACTAARIANGLAELVPSAFRVPHAALAELEAGLSPDERAAARQTAEHAVDEMRRRAARRIDADAALALPAPGRPVAAMLPELQAAAEAGRALTVTYLPASGAYAGPRVIEPLRLEWWGATPYVIAYCRHSQGERTFRIDRIAALGDGPE